MEDVIDNAKKKKGLQQRWSRTQRSENISREMNESKFRSLEKWFSREEWCEEEENASGVSVWRWVTKKCVCSKDGQEHKDLKRY